MHWKRHVRKSTLVQVREHLGCWLRFFFGTFGLFDFCTTKQTWDYIIHGGPVVVLFISISYSIFGFKDITSAVKLAHKRLEDMSNCDFLNSEILVRALYSNCKFLMNLLAVLNLPISGYSRQQIEYHDIL